MERLKFIIFVQLLTLAIIIVSLLFLEPYWDAAWRVHVIMFLVSAIAPEVGIAFDWLMDLGNKNTRG